MMRVERLPRVILDKTDTRQYLRTMHEQTQIVHQEKGGEAPLWTGELADRCTPRLSYALQALPERGLSEGGSRE